MQDTIENRDFLRIETSEVAQVLMNIEKQKLLAPFFDGELTIREAAAWANVTDLVMFRQVKRFESLGILRITRTEARRGRKLKYYQTTAKEFFIPAKVFPLERTLEQVDNNAQKIFLHNLCNTIVKHGPSQELGTRVVLSQVGTGNVSVHLATKPGTSWEPEDMPHVPIAGVWITTHLDLEEAKALRDELSSITERYSKKDGTQTYLLHLGLTPVESP